MDPLVSMLRDWYREEQGYSITGRGWPQSNAKRILLCGLPGGLMGRWEKAGLARERKGREGGDNRGSNFRKASRRLGKVGKKEERTEEKDRTGLVCWWETA